MYRERPSSIPGAVLWHRVTDGRVGRVVPDGCMDLMWFDDRLVVAGPDTVVHLSEPSVGSVVTGLRLGPGWGPRVFGVPASELRDQRADLDAVWPVAEVRALSEAVALAGHRGQALESIASARLAGSGPQPIVLDIARRLGQGDSVDEVARAVGLSSRQLRRASHDAFGYGPKTLARVLRLQSALDLVRSGRPPAGAAASAGYFDQAHLAREVRGLTGTTLRELMAV